MLLERMLLIAGLAMGCAPTIPGSDDAAKDSGQGVGGDEGGGDGSGGDAGSGGDDDSGGTPDVETYRLYINELMASNSRLALDPDDAEATPDWIELHNPNEIDIDLAGFTVTDDLDDPRMHVLGELTLPAGGFLVLLADDGEDGIHLPFKLGSDGDAVGLYDPDGVPLDQIQFTNLGNDQVAGRYPDDGPLVLLSEPTPGESNDSASVLE